MDLATRFAAALTELEGRARVVDEPSQWCRVVCDLLGVSGAGLIMARQLVRVPVGASGDDARVAEEVQASLGEGPCLSAEQRNSVLVADEADLRENWPACLQELTRRTSFRSTLSFPMAKDGSTFAALDLYSTRPVWVLSEGLEEIRLGIVEPLGELLLLRGAGLAEQFDQIYVDPGRHRQVVLVAVGMIIEVAAVGTDDAVALLRGYAFRTGRLLDDIALDLVHGHLDPHRVLESGD